MAASWDQGERRLPIIVPAAFTRSATHQLYKQVGLFASSSMTGPIVANSSFTSAVQEDVCHVHESLRKGIVGKKTEAQQNLG